MSDSELLLPPGDTPLCWRDVEIPRPDLGDELRFQAQHEAWARNRLEATKALVGPAAYQADLAALGEARDSNEFAFGGRRSVRFVLSPAGLARYIELLAGKGKGRRPKAEELEQLARSDRAAWGELLDLVVSRDFPWLVEESPASGGPATPAPSTSASSSS